MLLPFISFAQKWNNEGVYAMPEINDKKVRLKPWDTIREAFTFTIDSFKYSYAVMRPNGHVAVSVDYEEYGAWKIYKDTTLSEPDKHSGKEFTFEEHMPHLMMAGSTDTLNRLMPLTVISAQTAIHPFHLSETTKYLVIQGKQAIRSSGSLSFYKKQKALLRGMGFSTQLKPMS